MLKLLLLLVTTIPVCAQLPPGASPPAHGTLPLLAPNMARIEGLDAASGISYTRLFLAAKPSAGSPAIAPESFDLSQPTLTVQCTKDASGKLSFDLYLNFGSMADPAFYPPWKPTPEHPNASKTRYFYLTLEFRGYTTQSFKREFADDWRPATQLRYNPPGVHSNNLEPVTAIMQRLNALPSLRVYDNKRLTEFGTAPLLAQIRNEPLCKASGL